MLDGSFPMSWASASQLDTDGSWVHNAPIVGI